MLNFIVKRMFSFVRNFHFVFPPAMDEHYYWFTSSLVFGVVSILELGHSKRCVVVSHFNMHFSDDI